MIRGPGLRFGASVVRFGERRSDMDVRKLEETAHELVAPGKGILAADESFGTIGKRFAALGIESSEDSRRAYREMLFTTDGIGDYLSGVILFEETIRQETSDGTPMARVLENAGVIPGIKVDKSTVALPLSNGEKLALYAAFAQENDLVPIVEPEVLIDGDHSIEQCYEATNWMLHRTFDKLHDHGVELSGILLKPNMVISGKEAAQQADVEEVASATVECLLRNVPAAVPGIVFLSGGQTDLQATAHLNAMNSMYEGLPWELSFSYARALQGQPMEIWGGDVGNVEAAQKAFHHRAKMNSAARDGSYSEEMEEQAA